jgi:hypothetical protein
MAQYITKINTNKGPTQIDYTALANKPMISNENLLINSDFRRPINQRGQNTYEGSETRVYTVDRWCIGDNGTGMHVEVVDGGVKVTNNSQSNGLFYQRFEYTLRQNVYTATLKVKAISGTVELQCDGAPDSDRIELVEGVNTVTFTEAQLGSFVIYVKPSASITLEFAKFEQGNTPTPFVTRLYAEELALCQRYYQTVCNAYAYYPLGFGVFEETTFYGLITLPTPLRARPTVKVNQDQIHVFVPSLATQLSLNDAVYDVAPNGLTIGGTVVGTTVYGEVGAITNINSSITFSIDAEIYDT